MQSLACDYRQVVRYARVEPADDDEHGDAVSTYERGDETSWASFTPMASSLSPSDSGLDDSQTRFRVIIPWESPCAVGDRLGPADGDTPSWEVVECVDYPGSQQMVVRLIRWCSPSSS